MKILILNGSPRRKNSITLKICSAIAEGISQAREDAEIETIELYDKKIGACRADFRCWFKEPGVCGIDDDVADIYDSIDATDLVIWSMPLYCFGMPSVVSALLERGVKRLRPAITIDELGRASHPGFAEPPYKHMLVMSGAFPDTDGNFDACVFRFKRFWGEPSPIVTCPESSLFMYRKSDSIRALTEKYLEDAREAGRSYGRDGSFCAESLKKLNSCMMDRQEYIDFTNGR